MVFSNFDKPYGRIGSGIIELITSILLFVNKTKFYAAIMATGIMFAAFLSHLFILGIEVMNDGGTLFTLATVTFVLSGILSISFIFDLKSQKIE